VKKVKKVVQMLGGLGCLVAAELAREASFLLPSWEVGGRPEWSPPQAAMIFVALGFFFLGVTAICDAVTK